MTCKQNIKKEKIKQYFYSETPQCKNMQDEYKMRILMWACWYNKNLKGK